MLFVDVWIDNRDNKLKLNTYRKPTTLDDTSIGKVLYPSSQAKFN